MPGAEGIPVYYHPDYEAHLQPMGHPESPDRVKAIISLMRMSGLRTEIRNPVPASVEDILLAHGRKHLERIRNFGTGYMDPDTFHTEDTYRHSLLAAGGTCMAVRDAYDEKGPTFVLARPPGHHAGSDYNMGFCYFNNVAIAAMKVMRDRPDISKLAIIDIDAHHGNGTSDIFISSPDILYISTHQWGIFPGTGHYKEVGKGPGEGFNVNMPLRGGTGDPTFREISRNFITPITKEYGPDLIIVSLGADAHHMDPLTGLSLSSLGFLDLIQDLIDLSSDISRDRICFELEGGYHLGALAETVVGAMNLCSDQPVDLRTRYNETREAEPDTVRLREFTDQFSSYWRI